MEYVKLDNAEQVYGKKELLHAQLEILSITKRYQRFKDLRRQELALKNLLRRKIIELNEQIKIIDRTLPHVKTERTQEDKTRAIIGAKKRQDFESEIEEIKRKIARLQE